MFHSGKVCICIATFSTEFRVDANSKHAHGKGLIFFLIFYKREIYHYFVNFSKVSGRSIKENSEQMIISQCAAPVSGGLV